MDPVTQFLQSVSWWDASTFAGALLLGVTAVAFATLLSDKRRTGRSYHRAWKPRLASASSSGDLADPKFQMECISRVDFEAQPLLNRSEYQVLLLLEVVVRELQAGHRVMAQTSMGEILRPRPTSSSKRDEELAFRSINSKRVDFLIVDRRGLPALAVEYQGHGHYRERSFMRDAVKREVFRKANVEFLEVPAEFRNDEVRVAVRKLLKRSAIAAE